jgi:hypothetical protein
MYELFLVACVGVKICQYLTAPISYPTESRCHIAAALLAGQVRGTENPGKRFEYRHECQRKFSVAELKPKSAPDAGRLPVQ